MISCSKQAFNLSMMKIRLAAMLKIDVLFVMMMIKDGNNNALSKIIKALELYLTEKSTCLVNYF